MDGRTFSDKALSFTS